MRISVVINTYNEEKNIARCLNSVKNFANEIIVVDMHSTDKTVEITKKFKAKIFYHEYTRFVEPARNFALQKAKGDWIFLIDADEELSPMLADKLNEISQKKEIDFVEIPRKNIIFGKWIMHSRWWPDYLIRFFRKETVEFSDKIHIPPSTKGQGIKLEEKEEYALVHYNFQSISQYIDRLNRYSDIQSAELIDNDYNFDWKDLIIKPSNEFFSRFFAGEGYKDGIHGLALSLLQSFSELAVYLKVWEKKDFENQKIENFDKVFLQTINDYLYWQAKIAPNILKKLLLKVKAIF